MGVQVLVQAVGDSWRNLRNEYTSFREDAFSHGNVFVLSFSFTSSHLFGTLDVANVDEANTLASTRATAASY